MLMWMAGNAHRLDRRIVDEFTRKTGIPVRFVPVPESASQQLTQELILLEHGSSAVDVFQVDTTWPAIVASYMLDLKDVLAKELSDEQPAVVENATIDGRIIAAPLLMEYGMLYYRSDLLKKYGFSRPPHTWSELETEASRIQRGERLRGRPDFWGYVWQGADYEGLTCNALEWQSSHGGGNPLEQDHAVNVNNPAAIRAFSRAAGWVGTISPPGVVAYIEEDSRNIWQSGRAAFLRSWGYVYPLAKGSAEVSGKFSVAPVPAGPARRASVLGGWYLGISKRTRHRNEAIEFLRYMLSRQVQTERAVNGGFLPPSRSLSRDRAVLHAIPFFASISSEMPDVIIRRPASLAGARYGRVSRAYAHGVHMILTGNVTPAEGASAIQADLVHLTGFADRPQQFGNSAQESR